MGKQVVTLTYWLGILSAVLAVLTRGLDILGKNFLAFATKGNAIGYRTFLDGAVFFLVISIATANYFSQSLEKRNP